MNSLNTLTLECNRQIKINFAGGDLSSDAGLLLIKEFAAKLGFTKLIKNKFKTNDKAVRLHMDDENLMQMIYQIIASYFEDDCADELTNDPVFNAILDKDGLTGDLLKAELRDGTLHWSNDADKFMEPILQEYLNREIKTYLRGDSGFSTPKLYEMCECNGCSYAIRLKQNKSLIALASDKDDALYEASKENQIDYTVTYGEFMYQAGSWDYPRRVVFKIEKPYGQLTHMYTFIVTNMDMEAYQVIQFYCGRGKMENFIKEGKSGFDFAAVSSHSKTVNANRMRIHMLAYNLFNWFRRMVLPANMRNKQVDTIRLKLMKIATRAVKSARYITFKLCSSCPYKKEFYETLGNIQHLIIQLE